MDFSGLVSSVHKIGVANADLLIIIPCFKEYSVLLEHLELLAKQTFQKFDLLLVLGPDFPDNRLASHLSTRNYPFAITYAKRNEDTGSAGGFFTGQKYALENGYKYMVLADADCLPIDASLLSELWHARRKGIVSSSVCFICQDCEPEPIKRGDEDARTSFSFYTIMPRGMALQYGLYFAPLYCGYEDAEYRLRLGGIREFVKSRTSHPGSKAAFFTKPEKGLSYSSNQVAFCPFSSLPRFFLVTCPLLAALFLFYGRRGQNLITGFFMSIFLFAYGKRAARLISRPMPAQTRVLPPLGAITIASGGLQDLAQIASLFRKNVEIAPSSKISVKRILILSALARRLYWRGPDGRYAILCDNPGAFQHVISIALFLPVVVLFFMLFILSLPIKMVCRPKTLGFGINPRLSREQIGLSRSAPAADKAQQM